jgi:hypothetical protein
MNAECVSIHDRSSNGMRRHPEGFVPRNEG